MLSRGLYEACRNMNVRPDLHNILHGVMGAVGADVAYVKLADANGLFRIGHDIGLRCTDFRNHAMAPGQGLGGYALHAGVTVCHDYFSDGRFRHCFDQLVAAEGLHSLVVAPLPFRDRVLGLLYAGWRNPVSLRKVDAWQFGVLAVHAALIVAPLQQTTHGDKQNSGTAKYRLSRRQLEILRLRSQGHTVPEIAHAMGISQHTVRFHIRRLMGKLGCSSEVTLVAKAFREGIL